MRLATTRYMADAGRVAAVAACWLLADSRPLIAGFVERYRDWSLYVHEDPSGKVCFVTSLPIKQEGSFSRRDQPRAFVTQFGGARPRLEVSVDPGYNYRNGSTVEVAVDGARFELFTEQDRAWASDAETDTRLVEAMRRGNQMTVRGTSVRETWSLDTYSLAGFGAALRSLTEACRHAAAR